MPKTTIRSAQEALRELAMSYPEAYEERPWDHPAFKVRGKAFAFLSDDAPARLSLSAKLPASALAAVAMPWAEPTHYGLGKHGWVTATFRRGDEVPLPALLSWVDESYRAIAPKRLVKTLPPDGPPAAATKGKAKAKKKPPAAAKKKKKAKAAKKTKTAGRAGPVLLVGDDALRLARASEALAALGLAVAEPAPTTGEALARASRRRPSAIVIDLGRRAPRGLELAAEIAETEFGDVPLVLAGVRDRRMEERAAGIVPDAVVLSRRPPGDPEVVEQVAALARG